MHGCRRLLPILAVAGALAAPASAGAAVTEFSTNLTAGSQPVDITRGPDGNLWFTENANPGAIGRITPAGAVTEYLAGGTPPPGAAPGCAAGAPPGFPADQARSHIVSGPDGALWFTEEGKGGQIGR